jgi:hypothetical protein
MTDVQGRCPACQAIAAQRETELKRDRDTLAYRLANQGLAALEVITQLNNTEAAVARVSAERDRYAALLRDYLSLADVTHAYAIQGGHDSLGENLSCAGCALRDRIRAALDGPAAQQRAVLDEIAAERARQDKKFGEQNHRDGTGARDQQAHAETAREWCKDAFASGYGTWSDVLAEEVAEANAERDPAKLRAELVQVAAVAVAWIEAIDRRNGAQK